MVTPTSSATDQLRTEARENHYLIVQETCDKVFVTGWLQSLGSEQKPTANALPAETRDCQPLLPAWILPLGAE